MNSNSIRRGTGITTRQLQHLPKNGVFIWCNNDISYPQALARKIGRPDIKIYRRGILLSPYRLSGMTLTEVWCDHACERTKEEWRGWADIRSRIR